jgi:DtxR family transcriptional regulator, Mn-dependent transcriptional regulator
MTNPILIGLAVVAVALFALWPKHGLVARWRQAVQLTARFRREDALKHILKCEANAQAPTLESVSGLLQIRRNEAVQLLQEMEQHGLVSFDQGRLRLRPPGRELAMHVVRAHRLWESYLAEQTGVAESEWHERAERQEHLLTQQQADAIAAQLGHPTHDPHGDVIPGPTGVLPADSGQPLTAAPLDAPLVIRHVEDEPWMIFAQIVAQGLRPGMKVVVIERTPERVRFWADGNEHILAPILANNIAVVPLPEVKATDLFAEEYLSGLKLGQQARVLGLSPACRGAERRRLLDLGFVPGTQLEVDMVSPGGDPTAYRVRGSVIALRREQAGLVRISSQPAASA